MGGEVTTRILPRDEWTKLAGTDLEPVYAHLPDDTQIVVVENDEGLIIGHWAVIRYVHVECVWIDEAHRKGGSVARRLLTQMRKAARAWGAKAVWTASMDPEVSQLLVKLRAQPLPGDHYVFPIGE
jgi:hypothetical protein